MKAGAMKQYSFKSGMVKKKSKKAPPSLSMLSFFFGEINV
jgi:hypothetical protein